jgi:uncharacterized protein (TIGR03663 family)
MVAASATSAAAASEASGPEMEPRTWQLASLLVLIVATLVRLYALELNPLHHDEGVNSFFLINLINTGNYSYDPQNYHGPTLYYFALPLMKLCGRLGFGLSTFALRLVPVLFGVATVWLILCLRRRLGAVGALAGAALVALSPGAVYMSRYFIHESLFVFFTLGVVVASLRYYDSANPVYLMLASVSAALLFATKETAMISAGVILIAFGMAAFYGRFDNTAPAAKARGRARGARNKRQARNLWRDEGSETTGERFGGAAGIAVWSLSAAALFIFVYVLFYTSFFTHAQGVSDSLKTFEVWARTGRKDHVHEWYTYLSWLWQEEPPLLALGLVGALAALGQPRNRFAVFAALWAFGIIAAYSLIPYKTPWLALNFIVPLAISSGYGLDLLYRRAAADAGRSVLVLALAIVALVISGYRMSQLNFRHYDDDRYVYPYAHTVRGIFPLLDQINRFAAQTGQGTETRISITSADYWPLPWYLRDYKHIGYYAGRVAVSNEALVIGSDMQEPELESLLGDRYRRLGSFALRPSVTLILYARRDLLRNPEPAP